MSLPSTYVPLPVSFPTSWNEPSSQRLEMRSRIVRRPCVWCFATASSPPRPSAKRWRSFNSSASGFHDMSGVHDREDLALAHRVVLLHADLDDRALHLREHGDLHLHRFEDHQRVLIADRVAWLLEDLPYGSRDFRLDFLARHGFSLYAAPARSSSFVSSSYAGSRLESKMMPADCRRSSSSFAMPNSESTRRVSWPTCRPAWRTAPGVDERRGTGTAI